MIQTKPTPYDAFTRFVASTFFLILFFGHTLAYFNSPDVSNGFVLSIVEMIYLLKKVLLFASFVCVFFRKKISIASIITVFVVATTVLYTYVISPEQIALFTDVYLDFFCGITFFLLLVGGTVQIERLMSMAIFVGRVLLIICFLSIFTQANWEYFVSRNYMFISNAFLAPIAISIYGIFQKGHWWDYVLVIAGILVVLLYGSRGDFLVLAILAVVMLYLKIKKKNILLLLPLIPVLIAGVFILINSGILANSGSRTIEKIFSGEFFESTGRFEIWGYLISRSFSNALIGRGLCADRFYLLERQHSAEQVYAHNFFIEVFVDFGIVGIVAAVCVVAIFVKFIAKCYDSEKRNSIIMLSCVSFFPLMFSRTFLAEPGFFMMLGVILNWRLIYKNQGEKVRNEKGIGDYSHI